jgi:hypothetical protein
VLLPSTSMPQVLLIGTGPMGVEYAKVLQALNIEFVVVGRGIHSAAQFAAETGLQPTVGGPYTSQIIPSPLNVPAL